MRKYKFWIGALALVLILAGGALTGVAPASWLKTDYGLTNLGSLNLVPDSNAATAFRVQNSSGVAVHNTTPAGAYSLSNSSGTEQFGMSAAGTISGLLVDFPMYRTVTGINSGTRSGAVFFYPPDWQTTYNVTGIKMYMANTTHGGTLKFFVWQSGDLITGAEKDILNWTTLSDTLTDETFTWLSTLNGGGSLWVQQVGGTYYAGPIEMELWLQKRVGSTYDSNPN